MLTVIKMVPKQGKNNLWECLCDCGNTKILTASELNDKRKSRCTKSCGCLKHRSLPNKHKGIFKLPQGEAGFYSYVLRNKHRAKNKNLEFDLTDGKIKHLTQQNCFYCNKPPSQILQMGRSKEAKEHSTFIYNGIDRLNSKCGYTLDNCVACCGQCNSAKNVYSVEEFFEWITKCYLNLKEKGVLEQGRS